MNWDTYFIEIAKTTALRSSCIRRQIGCVIVKDNQIISTGYNGTPIGIKNCNNNGCQRCNEPNIKSGEKLDECVCLHAEENGIIQVSKRKCHDATIYCTHYPCLGCIKRIIQAGIKTIYYIEEYKDNNNLYKISNNLLIEAGIRNLQFK